MAHPDNHFYGHDRALARYAGFDQEVPVILGRVQHGWMAGTGLLALDREVGWLPKFVWSQRNAQAAIAAGHSKVRAIGAPFLYLAAHRSSRYEPQDRTLVYPHHSWERAAVLGDHSSYVKEILEREGDRATVVLYWTDYLDTAVRSDYERAGLRVVCHGRRSDPLFLERVHEAMMSHRRVVSNRVGSAIWYAAALGRHVEVYGPLFVVQETTGQAVAAHSDARRRWPELFDDGVDGEKAHELARSELGADSMLPADELVYCLGWDRPAWKREVVRGAVHLEHRIRTAWSLRSRLV